MVAELGLDRSIHLADLALFKHSIVEFLNHLTGFEGAQAATLGLGGAATSQALKERAANPLTRTR